MVLMFSPVRYKFFLQQYLLNFPPAFDFYISGTYFDNWSDGDSWRSLYCCWRVTLIFYKSATEPHFTVASDLLQGVFYALSHTIHLQQTPISDTANLSSFPWIIAEYCRRLHQNYYTWISTVPLLIFLWIIIKKKLDFVIEGWWRPKKKMRLWIWVSVTYIIQSSGGPTDR